MSELFYTDPLAAAYMAREFGVRYIGLGGGEKIYTKISFPVTKTENGLGMEAIVDDAPNLFITHPESQAIFEPQVGDVIREEGIGFRVIHETPDSKSTPYVFSIIQRDNKPFFMPEKPQQQTSEAAQ